MKNLMFRNLGLGLAITFGLTLMSTPADAIDRRGRGSIHFEQPAWSVQLLFDKYTEEEEYKAATLSLKHQYSEYGAWRISLTGAKRVQEYDNDLIFRGPGFDLEFDRYPDFDLDGGEIKIQHLFYPSTARNVNLYWGIGPRLTAYDAKSEVMITYYDDFIYNWADYAECRNATRLGLGLESSLGMEVYLGPNFSLLGEIGLALEHRWYIFDMRYYYDNGYYEKVEESFVDGLHFDSPRVSLGMAVHF